MKLLAVVTPPYIYQYVILTAVLSPTERMYLRSSTYPDARFYLSLVVQKVTTGTIDTWNLPKVYLILSP